ncbi:MAG TPA: hypothetical protein VN622_11245 [Clostridia bacterium]|nr:hypothetical protein [Clostridia bacterium]
MNVHFSYKLPKTPALEQHIQQQIDKLRKRLQVFRPELISLYGTVEANQKTGTVVSLNLRLPSGQMAAQRMADSDVGAVKRSFEDLTEQLTKHKDHLRRKHTWPRERGVERERLEPQVPFEETIAAIRPEMVSVADISSYVDANLPRLQRYVERELRYRENNGQLRPGELTPEEVIDEAIASALDDRSEKPEKITLEPWLYRLANSAVSRLLNQTRQEIGSVRLESTPRSREEPGSDEPVLQFHQPDESLTQENLIADSRLSTPEDVAASDEMVAMVEMALRHAKPHEREAFILYTMEGFTANEIAVITDRKLEEVRASIKAAREHLRKSFPAASPIKDKLIEHSRTA